MTTKSIIKATRDLDEMREIAARICREFLTGAWKTVPSDQVQLKRISGGLSNFLYHVSLPEKGENNNEHIHSVNAIKRARKSSKSQQLLCVPPEPKEVLLRIYGQMHGEQALETVLTDTVVFTLLSERRLGPKLHGIFPGGRIEQYIPARPLTTEELSDSRISSKIAEKMADIHSLNIPVCKEPEWLWKTMKRWLISSEEVLATFHSANATEMQFAQSMRAFNFRDEMTWLKQTIESEGFPVVFAHNDLQEGNILFKEPKSNSSQISNKAPTTHLGFFEDSSSSLQMDNIENIIISPSNSSNSDGELDNVSNVDNDDGRLQGLAISSGLRKRSFRGNHDDDPDNTRDSVLSDTSQTFCDNFGDPELMIIDFEYCAYNYRGFDVTNHFVEWTIDYRNDEFPFYSHRPENFPSREQQVNFIMSYLRALSGNGDEYEPSVSDVEQMLDEVRCFKMASHFFWTLWSIVNVHQEIEFAYWNYGAERLKHYIAAKEDYVKFKGLSLKQKHTLDDRQ